MSEIALSISKWFIEKTNTAPLRTPKPTEKEPNPEPSNAWAFAAFDNVRWSPEQIVTHITQGHAICVAETANNHRKGDYFKSAQVMGIDFDNGPDVTGLILNSLVNEYAFLIYATASSTPEAPRSRALFALDNPITDAVQYKRLIKRLLLAFNQGNPDEKCKDPVRIFYGSNGKRFSDVPDAVLPIEVLEHLPPHLDEIKPTYAPPVATAPNSDHSRYVQSALSDELAQLSSTRAGRNGALNEAAFALGTLVGSTWSNLSYFEVEQACYDAALANGYVQKDGEHAARATIKSGLTAGMSQPRPEPAGLTPIVKPTVAKNATVEPTPPPIGTLAPSPSPSVVWRTSVDSMQRYRERLSVARTDGKLPLVFPFKALHEFGGFCRIISPGVMIGVVGMSGGLKTSFVETITENWRQMDDNDVLWWGPEWSWEKMADRAVQRRGGANMTDVLLHEAYIHEKANSLKARDGVALKQSVYDESVRLALEIEQWPGMNHYIENMEIEIDDLLAASAQRLKDVTEMGRNIRIAVWDYAQLLEMRSVRSEPERITTILGRLKAFCVENSVIGMTASQVTKTASADSKENQKLLTSEAGQFFRGDKFNLVLTLNPIYEGKVLTDEGYINVDKNSIGRTGAVKVLIDPARLCWRDSVQP